MKNPFARKPKIEPEIIPECEHRDIINTRIEAQSAWQQMNAEERGRIAEPQAWMFKKDDSVTLLYICKICGRERRVTVQHEKAAQ